MTFDGIRVDHGALATASSDLQTAAQKISGRLEQLDSDLQPLAAQWAGAAQESYRLARAAWTTAMDEMVTLLTDVSTAVTASNEAYRRVDRRGAARFEQ